MNEVDLIRICQQKGIDKGVAPKQYGITEMYSQGCLIREYAGFPCWLPLCVCADHGAGDPHVLKSEKDNDAYAMLAFSKAKKHFYDEECSKPCYHIPHPFVWYRRKHNIKRRNDANGTIAFPAHSSADVDCRFDIDKYIQFLKGLPEEMQPVSACIFSVDVLNGMHKPFIEAGIPVYTAGNISDIRFVERYYDILSRFKYSTSNEPGSYLFYSIEMGIPFSLCGGTVSHYCHGNIDWDFGYFNLPTAFVRETSVCIGIHTAITPEQQNLVDRCFDDDGCITPEQLRDVLYMAWKNRSHPYLHAINGLRRLAKRKATEIFVGKRGLWE